MITNEQFRKWQASVAAQDDARIRADIAAEFAEHDRLRADAAERERGAHGFARALRHADRLPGMGDAAGARHREALRTDAERAAEREAARRAEIRSGIEAEMRQWDRERQPRQAPAPAAPQDRAQAAQSTRVGTERSYRGYGRYRWDGASWQRIGPAAA